MIKEFLLSILLLQFVSPIVAQKTFQIKHGPYLQEVTTSGVTFAFLTSEKSASYIELNEEGCKSTFITSDTHNDAVKLKCLLELCDYRTCDAFYYAGDVMSHMSDPEAPFKAFIDTSVEMFATSIPFELVRGNHETRGKLSPSYPELFPKNDGRLYGSDAG